MATAEHLATSSFQGGRSAPASAVSLATLGAVAAVLLMYVSSSFQVADIFGIKRIVQIILICPIGAVAAYFMVSRPARLLDPLILFAFARMLTELALRGRFSYVLDSLSAALALLVINGVSTRSFDTASRVLVTTTGVFALMALVQWLILIYSPDLNVYVLAPIDEGEHQDPIRHPIALLGFGDENLYTLAGISVGRMQSFAKEPSLNVAYFMLPASFAFMRNSRASFVWGCVMLLYCVLSLSGSVFLACGFAAFWWLLTRVISIRAAVPYGMLLVMISYVAGLHSSGLSFLNFFDYISQYGDYLNKSASATSRGQGALTNSDAALASPFGSGETADIPGPWLASSAMSAGWLGVIFLLWFLVRLGRELQGFYEHSLPFGTQRFGCLMFFGVLATVLVFNDYQMGNYVGLVLMAFVYRTMWLRNNAETAVPA